MKLDRRCLIVLLAAGCAGSNRAPEGQHKPEFAVQVHGQGRPILFIPGLASAGAVWEEMVAGLPPGCAAHVFTLTGFAGQPPIAAPILPAVREAIARYITERKLDRPVIVGHSLGGFLALDLAATHPGLTGPLLIVDALPFLAAARDPAATADSVRAQAEAFRQQLVRTPAAQLEQYQRQTLRKMIRDDDKIELALGWFMSSDIASVGQATVEMMVTDLRPELDRIAAQALVIGTWIGYGGAVTRIQLEDEFRRQYAGLAGAAILISDAARHFVMFDDPPFLQARLREVLAWPVAHP